MDEAAVTEPQTNGEAPKPDEKPPLSRKQQREADAAKRKAEREAAASAAVEECKAKIDDALAEHGCELVVVPKFAPGVGGFVVSGDVQIRKT